jgi:hypothetical protein
MAINLWKVGGQPTAFSPLPSSGYQLVYISNSATFEMKFKAKSTNVGKLRLTEQGGAPLSITFALTSNLTEYVTTFSISGNVGKWVGFIDNNSTGDIIIQDIQLVEKPLPKLTINGMDGFLSGKWSLSANTRVVDDETLELNSPSAVNDISSLIVPVITGQTYTIAKTEGNGRILLRKEGAGGTSFFNTSGTTPFTFTVDETFKGFLYIRLDNNNAIGTFTFKKPMLNLGSTPAPYSKKTGERMVMPVKPRVKVAKKNLFDGVLIGGYLGNGVFISSGTYRLSDNFIPVTPNSKYSLTINDKNPADGCRVTWFDSSKTYINSTTDLQNIVMPSNAYYVKFHFHVNSINYVAGDKIQFEKGTPTPYEPYTEIIPPARKGLVMDGVTNYLQLPSMTMDSVEIDCLIDAGQSFASFPKIIDARAGLSNGFYGFTSAGVEEKGSGWLVATGLKKGERTTIRLSSSPFTDDIKIFSNDAGTAKLKGILYSVKCYLNGQVVASYDFTNPNNLVGDKVLQSAKNLIPSFDSGKWYLHPNFKVLGMDVGKLDATAPAQTSFFKLNTAPNANYLMTCITNSDRFVAVIYDSNNTVISSYGADTRNGGKNTITVPSNGVRMEVWVYSSATGSFDFIRPQLYELTGKEGTLFGNPIIAIKAPKRVLFAKR